MKDPQTEVPDAKTEVLDLGSGGIRLNLALAVVHSLSLFIIISFHCVDAVRWVTGIASDL